MAVTTPNRQAVDMEGEQELTRFAELHDAFAELGEGRADLQLRGLAAPPPLGFAVRLQPEPTSAGVELSLWLDGGKLSTWSGDGHPPLAGHDDQYVHLDLSAGYLWGSERYADAGQLAAVVVGWMEREIAQAPRRARMEVL